MFQIEIFDRAAAPLCEMNGVTNVRFAFDRTCLFDLPTTHYKNQKAFLQYFNLVRVRHKSIPEVWTGYVYDLAESDPDGRTVTVTCNPTKTLLAYKRSDISKFENKLPGEIFAALINQANADEHTGIYPGTSYVGQSSLTLDVRRDNIYDKIQELCDKAKLGWRLTYQDMNTSIATLVEKQQRDLTASVIILAGYDTAEVPQFRPDLSQFANSVWGIGKLPDGFQVPQGEDEYLYRPTVQRSSQTSIDKYGLRETIVEFADTSDLTTLGNLTQNELIKRSYPVISNSLTINNRKGLWGAFTDQDVIQLQIPKAGQGGVAVPILITGREVDPEKDLMTIAYEVIQGQKAETLDMYQTIHYGQALPPPPNPQNLLLGLAAYWKLDETGGDRVDSLNSSTLTPHNSPPPDAGIIGNGVQFNSGSQQYLFAPSSLALTTGNISFTWACWVWFTDTHSQAIFGKGRGDTDNGYEYQLIYYGDRFQWSVGNGSQVGEVQANTFGSASGGVWNFVLCSYDAVAATVNISINNGPTDSVFYPNGGYSNPEDFSMGVRSTNVPSYYANSTIDEVGFWKRLLTLQEQAALYNLGAGTTYPFLTRGVGE